MNPCQKCRGCCKFLTEDKYFATLFTDKEIETLKSKGVFKDVFKPYRKSKKVFQIQLIKSEADKKMWVCPYLDEKSHLCQIYEVRPLDCKLWPFIFMLDKNKNVILACFKKNMCQITENMNKIEFKKYTDDWLAECVEKYNIFEFINLYPEFIWDYEPETVVIQKDIVK